MNGRSATSRACFGPKRRGRFGDRIATAGLVALVSCGGGRAVSKSAPLPNLVVSPPPTPSALRALSDAASPAKSHRIATITRKAIGPFSARSADGGIAAWIARAERGGRQELVVVMLASDGAPVGAPQVAASVPEEATALVVRPAGGSRGGWLLAWSGLLDRGESLSVLGLGPDGSVRTPAVVVQQTNDHVRWIDIVPTLRGAACLWAEETAAAGANVLASSLDADGKPTGVSVRVAKGVAGWTAVRAGDGVGVALVTVDAKRGAKSATAGSLSWVRMDEAGRVVPPVVIDAKPTVSGDVEVAGLRDGWLFGWTDRTGEDPQVMLASVDAAGHLQGPTPALNAFGGSALDGLVTGDAGAALLWEEPRAGGRPLRALHLATVSTAGFLSAHPISSFEATANTRPELVATESGFALLTPAPSCPPDERELACSGAIVPTFVRLDASLKPAQTEPLFIGDDRARAAMAWSLRCAGDGCFVLAATSDTPTPVFAVDLSPRASRYSPPTSPPPPADAPRVSAVVTIASGQPFADVLAARLTETTIVATLTAADKPVVAGEARARGTSGRSRGGARNATIAVRVLDDKGGGASRWTPLTTRAIPEGGVALAAGPRPEDGAAVAWTARDDGNRKVHLNHVDRRGHRTNEVQLTSANGDASDVALAWAGDGWVVAWVDTRDGNGEVYATKVDRDLRRVAREERVTRSPGDASDVAIAVQGDTAWIAWSDPRESPREGLGDIYVSTLSAHDAKRTGEEVRVLATAAHSRSPCLAIAGGGAILGWIEEGPTGLEAPGAALVARIDSSGRVVGVPAALPLASDGNPTAMALAASGTGARAIVARSAREGMALDAMALGLDGRARTQAWPLVNLEAPASFDVALAVAGDTVFFDDTGTMPENRRVRGAAIAWPR